MQHEAVLPAAGSRVLVVQCSLTSVLHSMHGSVGRSQLPAVSTTFHSFAIHRGQSVIVY